MRIVLPTSDPIYTFGSLYIDVRKSMVGEEFYESGYICTSQENGSFSGPRGHGGLYQFNSQEFEWSIIDGGTWNQSGLGGGGGGFNKVVLGTIRGANKLPNPIYHYRNQHDASQTGTIHPAAYTGGGTSFGGVGGYCNISVWWDLPQNIAIPQNAPHIVHVDQTFQMHVQITGEYEDSADDATWVLGLFYNRGYQPKYVKDGSGALPGTYGGSVSPWRYSPITKWYHYHYTFSDYTGNGLVQDDDGYYTQGGVSNYQGQGTIEYDLPQGSGDVETVIAVHAPDNGEAFRGNSGPVAYWDFYKSNGGAILSCFTGGTKISMIDGGGRYHKFIKDIKSGDRVLSFNTDTNDIVESTVTEKHVHPDTPGHRVINNELEVTPNHELYDGKEWKPAGVFKQGDKIYFIDGTHKEIKSIDDVDDVTTTYDITVDSEHHNYFADGFLAHNKTIIGPPGQPPTTSCFTGDTRITMSDGAVKHIKDVEVGDEVLGYDTNTSETISSRVVKTFTHPNTEGYLVVNDNLNVTPEHPMYDGSEWKPISQFGVLDSIQTVYGNKKSIDKIEWCNDIVTTYNLEVESEHHNYFANDYLVHNKTIIYPPPPVNPPPPPKPPPTCFLAGTKIALADCTEKNIEDIKVGDEVKAFDTDKNEVIDSIVSNVFVHPNTDGYFIINNNIKVTGDHPLLVDGDWRSVDNINVGDTLQHLHGAHTIVDLIERVDEVVTTYNFEIESEYHNYFANNILAHNSKTIEPPRPPPKPPPPTTGKPTPPTTPCIPMGNPISVTLQIGCTACGTTITGDPKFNGITDSTGKLNVIQVCNPIGGHYQYARDSDMYTDEQIKYSAEFMQPIVMATAILPLSADTVVNGKYDRYWLWFEVGFYVGFNKDGQACTLSDPRQNVGSEETSHDQSFSKFSNIQNFVGYKPVDEEDQITAGFSEYTFHDVRLYHPAHMSGRWRHLLKQYQYTAWDICSNHPKIFKDTAHQTWDDYQYWKDHFGKLYYNPFNMQFQTPSLTGVQLNITRSLTAFSNELPSGATATTREARCYIPTGEFHYPMAPLLVTRLDNCTGFQTVSSFTEWIKRTDNFGATVSGICVDVEYPYMRELSGAAAPTLSGTGRKFALNQGLKPGPVSVHTHNTLSGYTNLRNKDGMISWYIGPAAGSRPKRQVPLASGVTESSRFADHVGWRKNHVYGNVTHLRTLWYRDQPTALRTQKSSLCGVYFNITQYSYFETCSPTLTAQRFKFDHNGNENYNIVDFSMFIGTSAYELYDLNHYANLVTASETLTSANSYAQAIGFCTFNGSLTASDGSFYFAALTRCKKPSWIQTAAAVGLYGSATGVDGYDNYVICTSGKRLTLPYLSYRHREPGEPLV